MGPVSHMQVHVYSMLREGFVQTIQGHHAQK